MFAPRLQVHGHHVPAAAAPGQAHDPGGGGVHLGGGLRHVLAHALLPDHGDGGRRPRAVLRRVAGRAHHQERARICVSNKPTKKIQKKNIPL